ncbi:MAG: hypothetical protein PVJ76_06375 [Gemmatimonadota bacterium]
MGIRAGPPRIKSLRETFFDTPDQTLRRRGMTCKLRQVEGEEPSMVVTVGEGPDSEGITSRSRLTAAAIGAGVFETLRGDSEPALQVQKFVDPGQLRPQIALDIQRLGRVFRGGILLKPVLLLFFDRITVETGGTTSVFHELSVRRRREGGPLIRDLARQLRDQHHLFPDGLSRLQRAYRILSVEGKSRDPSVSPYGLGMALAVFQAGRMGLIRRGDEYHIPTFRGSGEDAARALTADLLGDSDIPLQRLGTTEPREGRAVAELWAVPDPEFPEGSLASGKLHWLPWDLLLERVGQIGLRDPTLISTLLLLTRRKLMSQLPWLSLPLEAGAGDPEGGGGADGEEEHPPELLRIDGFFPLLREAEDEDRSLDARLDAVSKLSKYLNHLFFQDVTRTKGKILSKEADDGGAAPIQLADLMSIRVRGIVDRLYRCLDNGLLEGLENRGVHLRAWAGLMHADRRAILDSFTSQLLPSMQVAPEWGPSFIPDMPLAGCAVGIMARNPGVGGTRFFHVVLGKDPPSFLVIPGTTMAVPLEEVIRGYFQTQMPELEQAETFMFRFTTGAATVRTPRVLPDSLAAEAESEDGEKEADPGVIAEEGDSSRAPLAALPPTPAFDERRESVVVRVLVHQKMPEGHQAQLIRALERQVTRRDPLIGWSDLYPVTGPLDLMGLPDLLESEGR